MSPRHQPERDQTPPPVYDYDEQLWQQVEEYEQQMDEEEDGEDF
jgi:hypothetical protein